jgi:hypothetical protein
VYRNEGPAGSAALRGVDGTSDGYSPAGGPWTFERAAPAGVAVARARPILPVCEVNPPDAGHGPPAGVHPVENEISG